MIAASKINIYALSFFSLVTSHGAQALTYLNHDYDTTVAQVRISNDTCTQEALFLSKRLPFVKKNLEALTGLLLCDDEVPRITLCCSGGGYRAMLATLGFLDGMDTYLPPLPQAVTRGVLGDIVTYITNFFTGNTPDLKPSAQPITVTQQKPTLINTCTYMAGLSGSTWALNGWLQANMRPGNYSTHIQHSINQRLIEDVHVDNLLNALATKKELGQQVSLIDWYGCLIAQKLLMGLGYTNTSMIDTTDIASRVAFGQAPLPISINVIETAPSQYAHIEYTPFEVGSPYLNAYIPLWAFGRKFDQGKSCNFNPPASLGFCMGVWGSAMSINLHEAWRALSEGDNTITDKMMLQLGQPIFKRTEELLGLIGLHTTPLSEQRLVSSQVDNWTFGCPGTQQKTTEKLTLVDAGVFINIPIQPLLDAKRQSDIIIILDSSSGKLGQELYNAECYARENGLPFPHIDYTTVNASVSVHGDPYDEKTPRIIYMPLVKMQTYQRGWDPRTAQFTSTFNFAYTADQVELLSGLTRHAMICATPTIVATIRELILARRNLHHALCS